MCHIGQLIINLQKIEVSRSWGLRRLSADCEAMSAAISSSKSDLVTKLIHLSVHSFFAVWDFKFLQLEAYDVRQIIEYYLDVIICIVATL